MSEKKHLRNGKAPVPKSISNELLKRGGQTLAEQLTKLYNKILTSATTPTQARCGRAGAQGNNTGNTTVIKTRTTVTDEVNINTGVREGDSVSGLLSNLIMDKIVDSVLRVNHDYRMGDKLIKVLCYADDATLFADSQKDLQWLLQVFNIEAQKPNMEISISKTKSMLIAKNGRTGIRIHIFRHNDLII
ncbi:hypothetical protein Trydic_g9739 [Trypoxylus dichotomus]